MRLCRRLLFSSHGRLVYGAKLKVNIYAPEQDVVWYQMQKGGLRTVGKYRASYLEPAGKTKSRIKIKSTGEIKMVPSETIISLSDFKGSHYDLK